VGNQRQVKINGLFKKNNKQYGVRLENIGNPAVAGPTAALIIEVQNKDGLTIASRSTLSRLTILEPI